MPNGWSFDKLRIGLIPITLVMLQEAMELVSHFFFIVHVIPEVCSIWEKKKKKKERDNHRHTYMTRYGWSIWRFLKKYDMHRAIIHRYI